MGYFSLTESEEARLEPFGVTAYQNKSLQFQLNQIANGIRKTKGDQTYPLVHPACCLLTFIHCITTSSYVLVMQAGPSAINIWLQ